MGLLHFEVFRLTDKGQHLKALVLTNAIPPNSPGHHSRWGLGKWFPRTDTEVYI